MSILTFAKGRNDTGVIASWDTEALTVDGKNPVLLPGGIAIDPITRMRKPQSSKMSPRKPPGDFFFLWPPCLS